MAQQLLSFSRLFARQEPAAHRSAGLVLGLAVLAGVDILLMARLGSAIAAILAQAGTKVTPLLATAGCAAMAGAALLMTWLWCGDLVESLRSEPA